MDELMLDGSGTEVDTDGAALAVKCFADIWGTGQFDCGPQDYEFMASQICLSSSKPS